MSASETGSVGRAVCVASMAVGTLPVVPTDESWEIESIELAVAVTALVSDVVRRETMSIPLGGVGDSDVIICVVLGSMD